MTNIAPLNSSAHRNLRIRAGASARLGDNERFVPVIVGEFPLLAVHYPIFFSKDANTGAFYCGAMLGFDEGENLFLSEGGEHDSYRPLNLQRGPFFAVGNDLGIDLDNPRVGQAEGERLFNSEGEPTRYLESIMATMRELRPGVERTKVFIETLMKLKLIEPIDIKVSFDDGSSREVQGLYTVAHDSLKDLPEATVMDLFRRGYLYLIYLMIASVKQIPVLAQRKNRRMLQASAGLGGTPG